MDRQRKNWLKTLQNQKKELLEQLRAHRFNIIIGGERQRIIAGHSIVNQGSIVVASRLKKQTGIQKKMARFNESQDKVLDIIGHRIIVKNLEQLESVIQICRLVGDAPSKPEMLLRNGELQFPWLRDYRKKNHVGKSSLTSIAYNEAVHMNRKISGMICEIQIVTHPLYVKAFVFRTGSLSHAQFARRRTKIYK